MTSNNTPTTNTDVLFQPFQIKNLALKNRVVMAPMTRSFSPHGVPGANVAAYYRRRAEGEVGLILSEGTVIDRPAARNEGQIPFFHGEAALAGWQNVIHAVHGAAARWAHRSGTWVPWRIRLPNGRHPHRPKALPASWRRAPRAARR
ncbi:2,4-dienoyl-CoA reductase-like NADH-dependent reductase (Old Yellow Enzyme family) [Rhodanobacter sp. K2T2]|nr:2,4-dienoyl-CoA reductase-like NADH-dependent reductase (Old Yellow Enzyme family) [Rhodanobacter sp. K2T2]